MRPILLLMLAALALAAPATADQAWAPDWKMIAGDGSVLPSDCIGSTETLDCFIDTLAACSAWSEGPKWRPDHEFYDHPICNNVPNAVQWFLALGPAATQTHLYAIETWTLTKPEDWLLYSDDWAVARAGDTVVDVFTLTCAPDRACLESQDLSVSATALRAACPISDCTSGPYVGKLASTTKGQFDADAIYALPDVTLLVRKKLDKWQIVGWYAGSFTYGLNNENWYPDHWKRK